MKPQIVILLAGLTTGTYGFVADADAATLKLSYQYSGSVTTYPIDDGEAGSPNYTSGSGSQVFYNQDITEPLELLVKNESDGSSIIFSSPSVFGGSNILAQIFGTGPVTFEGDVTSDSTDLFGTYDFNFSVPNGFYFIDVPGGGIGANPNQGFTKNATGSISGSFTLSEVSSVPLPASAPLFGIAVLGLAGLGYMAKRKKEAAAA